MQSGCKGRENYNSPAYLQIYCKTPHNNVTTVSVSTLEVHVKIVFRKLQDTKTYHFFFYYNIKSFFSIWSTVYSFYLFYNYVTICTCTSNLANLIPFSFLFVYDTCIHFCFWLLLFRVYLHILYPNLIPLSFLSGTLVRQFKSSFPPF